MRKEIVAATVAATETITVPAVPPKTRPAVIVRGMAARRRQFKRWEDECVWIG